MKIWVYIGDAQQGPFDLDQLRQLPVTAETPVWYEGLEQWSPAGQAPATRCLFDAAQEGDVEADNADQSAEDSQSDQPSQPTDSDNPAFRPVANAKTFLGWSIALTICCCGSPLSIAALVGSIVTIMRNNRGDEQGAQKASNVTEWLVIIAIALNLAFMPFYYLISMI